MKSLIFNVLKSISVLSTILLYSGCEKDSNSIDSIPDPQGTIITNMLQGSWSTATRIHLADGVLYISESNNFSDDPGYVGYDDISLYNYGKVKGLAKVETIPENGYAHNVAISLGNGYVIKVQDYYNNNLTYGRLYVVSWIYSTSNSIIGAKVKYQYPFNP